MRGSTEATTDYAQPSWELGSLTAGILGVRTFLNNAWARCTAYHPMRTAATATCTRKQSGSRVSTIAISHHHPCEDGNIVVGIRTCEPARKLCGHCGKVGTPLRLGSWVSPPCTRQPPSPAPHHRWMHPARRLAPGRLHNILAALVSFSEPVVHAIHRGTGGHKMNSCGHSAAIYILACSSVCRTCQSCVLQRS